MQYSEVSLQSKEMNTTYQHTNADIRDLRATNGRRLSVEDQATTALDVDADSSVISPKNTTLRRNMAEFPTQKTTEPSEQGEDNNSNYALNQFAKILSKGETRNNKTLY